MLHSLNKAQMQATLKSDQAQMEAPLKSHQTVKPPMELPLLHHHVEARIKHNVHLLKKAKLLPEAKLVQLPHQHSLKAQPPVEQHQSLSQSPLSLPQSPLSLPQSLPHLVEAKINLLVHQLLKLPQLPLEPLLHSLNKILSHQHQPLQLMEPLQELLSSYQ
jgi:hypothetical protein